MPLLTQTNNSDTFTDADATNLAAHVSEIPAVAAWTVRGGSFTIQGNKAQGAAGAVSLLGNQATVQTNSHDGTWTGTYNQPNASTGGGPVFRYQDANNYWLVDLVTTTNTVTLYEVSGGVLSGALATASVTLNTSTDYVVVVILAGSTITVKVAGVTYITYTTATDFQGATIHGMRAVGVLAMTWDTFSFTGPAWIEEDVWLPPRAPKAQRPADYPVVCEPPPCAIIPFLPDSLLYAWDPSMAGQNPPTAVRARRPATEILLKPDIYVTDVVIEPEWGAAETPQRRPTFRHHQEIRNPLLVLEVGTLPIAPPDAPTFRRAPRPDYADNFTLVATPYLPWDLNPLPGLLPRRLSTPRADTALAPTMLTGDDPAFRGWDMIPPTRMPLAFRPSHPSEGPQTGVLFDQGALATWETAQDTPRPRAPVRILIEQPAPYGVTFPPIIVDMSDTTQQATFPIRATRRVDYEDTSEADVFAFVPWHMTSPEALSNRRTSRPDLPDLRGEPPALLGILELTVAMPFELVQQVPRRQTLQSQYAPTFTLELTTSWPQPHGSEWWIVPGPYCVIAADLFTAGAVIGDVQTE